MHPLPKLLVLTLKKLLWLVNSRTTTSGGCDGYTVLDRKVLGPSRFKPRSRASISETRASRDLNTLWKTLSTHGARSSVLLIRLLLPVACAPESARSQCSLLGIRDDSVQGRIPVSCNTGLLIMIGFGATAYRKPSY